jgi:hypothetical protein
MASSKNPFKSGRTFLENIDILMWPLLGVFTQHEKCQSRSPSLRGSEIIRFREESDWPLIWNAQFGLSQDSWLPATDYLRASRSFPRIAGSGNEIAKMWIVFIPLFGSTSRHIIRT